MEKDERTGKFLYNIVSIGYGRCSPLVIYKQILN